MELSEAMSRGLCLISEGRIRTTQRTLIRWSQNERKSQRFGNVSKTIVKISQRAFCAFPVDFLWNCFTFTHYSIQTLNCIFNRLIVPVNGFQSENPTARRTLSVSKHVLAFAPRSFVLEPITVCVLGEPSSLSLNFDAAAGRCNVQTACRRQNEGGRWFVCSPLSPPPLMALIWSLKL